MIGYLDPLISPVFSSLSGSLSGAYEALTYDGTADAAFTATSVSINITKSSEILIPSELDVNNTKLIIGSMYSNNIT